MRKCDDFFEHLKKQDLAVTYDEVRLKTGLSKVMPSDVSLGSFFSRNVPLKIPIVSAAMDTVTESKMAIALAKLGGIGVIHRNLTPKQQSEEAQRVKFHLSGIIAKPITVLERMTMGEVETMRKERNFSFYSFPVINSNGKLVGLLTENDFDFCGDFSQPVSKIMTRALTVASPSISMNGAYDRMKKEKKKVLPLINSDGTLAGLYLFTDLKRILLGQSKMYNVDKNGRLRVAAAIGTGEEEMERLQEIADYVDAVVIDTAHGDSDPVFRMLKAIKKKYDLDVVAGNISEGDSARRLVKAGVDGIKVGQGPGSICTTRIVAGIGCPQVTAIYSVSKAIEGTNIPVCADGGIENSGSIPIAIGAGAHSVMLGKLLAGTTEAPGEVDFQFGSPMKYYRGMGSLSALESSRASRERYRQSDGGGNTLVPEGVEAAVPYTGDLSTIMHQYIGGLQKGMGYVGAATIPELRKKADFWRITSTGMKESHPHGVRIMRDAPNYKRDSD
ncbi:MAG: IMP dehydrogenase [Candidatus Kaiserbacteria bacterium]|nr:IMP dehydrogenase [Candidatus Kaiserbacteria bacterium]